MNLIFKIICIIAILYRVYRANKKAQKIICRKPNVFAEVIAPPGTGKSCLSAKITSDNIYKGKKVFSTTAVRGAIKIDIKELGKRKIENAVLLLDEAGTYLNNRNWHTNLTNEAVEFIKKHRHYNVDVYCFSQAPGDFDNKFRDLVTQVYLLNKSKIPFYVFAQAIKKVMKLENGQILEYYVEDKEESYRFFIPPTWAYFDSWERNKDLEESKEYMYSILDLQ